MVRVKVALAVSLVVASLAGPLAAQAQPGGRVYRVGLLAVPLP